MDERILIELMKSDGKQRGIEMKELRDLNDLMMNNEGSLLVVFSVSNGVLRTPATPVEGP